MPKSDRQVDIAVIARDETAGVFQKVAAHAKLMNAESRQTGELAFEKMLKGAGAFGLATFAVETFAKIAEGAREAIKGIEDGSLNTGEAVGKIVEKGVEAIPLFGHLVKGFGSIIDGINDVQAHVEESFGATREYTDAHVRSAATVKANYEAVSEAMNKLRTALQKEVTDTTIAKSVGVAKDMAEEERRHQEKIKNINAERKAEEEKAGSLGKTAVDKLSDARRENEAAEHAAKLNEIHKKQADHVESITSEHDKKMNDLAATAHEQRLREAGRTDDAEIEAARRHFEQMEADAEKRARAERKDHPENAVLVDKQLADERKAIASAMASEITRIETTAARQRENVEREHWKKVSDILFDARQKRLQGEGKVFDAELEAATHRFKEETDKVNQAIAEKMRQTLTAPSLKGAAELANEIVAASAAKGALSAQFAEESKNIAAKQAAATADQQASFNHTLTQARIDALEAEGAAGNGAATVEAERLRIADDYAQKREQIIKMLRDEKGLTEDQRATAKQLLADLEAAEKKALKKKPESEGEGEKSHKADFEESRFLSGVRAGANREQLEVSKQQLDIQNNLHEVTKLAQVSLKNIETVITTPAPADDSEPVFA